jgi:tRNA(Ile)-lysidine synthase
LPDSGAVHHLSSHPTVQQLLARCTFPPAGTPVTCAVSGGADSLALLALAVAAGCQVEAVHVDHQLRPDSHAEAEVVRAAAHRLGARFRAERVHVGEGPNLEARARDARYAVLPPDVLTGHTADDQAETVLINVLRGAGLQGLAAIRAGHRRPLLALRRIDTESVCAILGWQPVSDPSNTDRRHLRNRIRHEALPQLGELAQRDLVPLLARQAALAADDADLLDELALAVDATDAKALALAHPALARRAVRRWLTGPHPPDAATVERVLEVARGHAIATEVGSGRRVERHRQRLSLVGLRETSASEYPDQAI